MRIEWAEEDANYIATRSGRYPGALDIDIEWTREVLADPRLVAVVPYPSSRIGAAAFARWSPSAQRVLLVLAYQDLDGDLHGLNAWPASGRTSPPTTNGTPMKKLDDKGVAALREDARRLEQHANSGEPYPDDTVVIRPNAPSRMFNLRLSEEQFDALQQIASAKHLPMSTMARAWLLDRLDEEERAS